MVQSNTHNLRTFIDKTKSFKQGKQILDSHELISVGLELADLLLYMRDLEQQIVNLKQKIQEAETIEINMDGEKF